jgi:hypothetical protein
MPCGYIVTCCLGEQGRQGRPTAQEVLRVTALFCVEQQPDDARNSEQ